MSKNTPQGELTGVEALYLIERELAQRSPYTRITLEHVRALLVRYDAYMKRTQPNEKDEKDTT